MKEKMVAQALLNTPPPLPPSTGARTTLYVGDLHPEVKELDLELEFGLMGPLHSVRIFRDQQSQRSLCYALVQFLYPFHASRALSVLNHVKLKGKPARIMWWQGDPCTRKSGVANLFVKNLHRSIDSSYLERIFCEFGAILSCKVAELEGMSKGFGFVQFEHEESAVAALKAVNGAVLGGKKIYISKFIKKSERENASAKEIKFTSLYLSNLDVDSTEDLLRDKFSDFGKVSDMAIIKAAEGRSRGFGFVNFESHGEAKKAMELFNDARIGTKKWFVGMALEKSKNGGLIEQENGDLRRCQREQLAASILYVKNFDSDVDDQKLKQIFGAFGRVTSAKVMRDESGISKGFGFVCFSNPAEARKAKANLHRSFSRGKHWYVGFAERNEERLRKLQTIVASQCLYDCNSNIWAKRQYLPFPHGSPFFHHHPPNPIFSARCAFGPKIYWNRTRQPQQTANFWGYSRSGEYQK